MILGVSFKDVISIPAFADLTQFDLLKPKMDAQTAPYLFKLGMNIDKPVIVQACKHRTLDKQSIIGYRYCGHERTDKEWLNNSRCTMSARIASQRDPYLGAEMARMSAEGLGVSSYKTIEDKEEAGAKNEIYEDDWQESRSMMKSLAAIQVSVRGPLTNDENMFFDEAEIG